MMNGPQNGGAPGKRLPVDNPVGVAGSDAGVWIGDEKSRALVRCDATTASPLARIPLEAAPLSLASGGGLLAVATADGMVRALDGRSGAERWRCAVASRIRALGVAPSRGGGDSGVWVLCDDDSLLHCSGPNATEGISLPGITAFAPTADGVVFLHDRPGGAALVLADNGGNVLTTTEVGAPIDTLGAAAFCANAIWVSGRDSLLLFEPRALHRNAVLAAPEGPVAHLACDGNGRLFGGSRGLFWLNPAADAMVRRLPVAPASPIGALAFSHTIVWALESAAPVVHILDVP